MKIWLYCILVPLDIFGTIFCILFVNWWAALFCDSDGYLPRWLKWVGTFDNSCDAIYDKYPTTGSAWLDHTRWLYRNTAYGWSYYVLGCPYRPWQWELVEWSEKRICMKSAEGYFYVWRDYGWCWIKIGWKAANCFNWDSMKFDETSWGPQFTLPIVCSIKLKGGSK